MSPRAAVAFVGILAVFCSAFSLRLADAAEDCTYIDFTEDKCRSADSIVVGDDVVIRKEQYTTESKRITLPGRQTEIFWTCGGTKERTAWGKEANQLRVKYFKDGSIHWAAYLCAGGIPGPKKAGEKCTAELRQPYHCPSSVGNNSEPCLFELEQTETRSRSKTTTVEIEGTLRGEVSKSTDFAEAKASAEAKARKSQSVTDAVTFKYKTKTLVVIAPGTIYCVLKDGESVKDIDASSGFKWQCSGTKFVQAPGSLCSELPACDDGVCAAALAAAASIQVGAGVLGFALLVSCLLP